MKKVLLTGAGSVDSLQIIESEIPEPGAGEVLVKVEAAGVAFADVMMRHGKYPGAPKFPFTPGYDVAGRIEKPGENPGKFNAGDRVVGMMQFGGYSQYAVISVNRLLKVPEKLPASELVCLPLNYVTAYQMLRQSGKLKAGSVILVHSAAGGVGTALLQLAEHHDIKVYGTASNLKHDVVKACGGIPIDYKNEDFTEYVRRFEPDGIDAVFDPIGGEHLLKSHSLLKKGGSLVGFGMLSMFEKDRVVSGFLKSIMIILKLKIFSKGRKFIFYGINFKKDPEGYIRDLQSVLDLYAAGKIKPLVGRILPLEEVREAHELLSNGRVSGKIVLDCG